MVLFFTRLFVILAFASCPFSYADVIDFEGYAPNGGVGGVNVTQFPMQFGDYYVYSPLNGSAIWNETSFYVRNGIYPDSGSDWLASKSLGIDPVGGGIFSLLSADLAETFYIGHPRNNVLNYILVTASDDIVKGALTFDEIFGFENVKFGSVFSSIRQIYFSAEAAFSIDNIVVSRSVPEPSSIALLILGMIGLLGVRKYRKQ